jgi:hypothetical protein
MIAKETGGFRYQTPSESRRKKPAAFDGHLKVWADGLSSAVPSAIRMSGWAR